jgi:ATP-dependent Clp protease ATP-binding subunit ClpA
MTWPAVKERYEVHHGVRITDGAIVCAAVYSHRYITDRFLPDKVHRPSRAR